MFMMVITSDCLYVSMTQYNIKSNRVAIPSFKSLHTMQVYLHEYFFQTHKSCVHVAHSTIVHDAITTHSESDVGMNR